MGLPTHIRNDEDQKSYDAKLAEKLAAYPHLDLMVIDQLRIILSQCRLIDAMLSQTTGISSSTQLEYERDLCKKTQTYLNPISDRLGLKAGAIRRQLRRIRRVNKDLLSKPSNASLDENAGQCIEQGISAGLYGSQRTAAGTTRQSLRNRATNAVEPTSEP